jgi:hypothetical protein
MTNKRPKPNAAAVALGRLGGQAGTKAQHRARRANAKRGGRPGRVCTTCGEPVHGGHKDARLDATCSGVTWRWQKPADK